MYVCCVCRWGAAGSGRGGGGAGRAAAEGAGQTHHLPAHRAQRGLLRHHRVPQRGRHAIQVPLTPNTSTLSPPIPFSIYYSCFVSGIRSNNNDKTCLLNCLRSSPARPVLVQMRMMRITADVLSRLFVVMMK